MEAAYKCDKTHRQGVTEHHFTINGNACDLTHMPRKAFPIDAVRRSIQRLLDETGEKAKPLAKDKLGLGETGIRDIFLEKTKSVGGAKLAAIAGYFGVSVESILEGTATTREAGDDPIPAPNARVVPMEGASLEMPRENLPVWGSGLGAEREFEGEAVELTNLNTGGIVEYVRRPTILNGKQGVYALYVQGSSMHPALPDGEMIVAVRDMPMSIGDNVVVYLRTDNPDDDDGETSRGVLVKELVRRTASYVELRQYQPAKDFRVDMRQVVRIDRVLTRREMLS